MNGISTVLPGGATVSAIGCTIGGALGLVTLMAKAVLLDSDGPRASATSVATRRTVVAPRSATPGATAICPVPLPLSVKVMNDGSG